jgi:UDP-N-acetylmuramoyl-tripeptide--D-alanyl-D-alanine ligase
MQYNWNYVILVGGDYKNTKHSYMYFDNTDEAKTWFQKQTFENMAFLIKGSRAIAMEKIISQ